MLFRSPAATKWCFPGCPISRALQDDSFFSDGVEMITNLLVHAKHVYPGLLEDCLHFLIAENLALIARILQVIALDMLPELLDHLRTG